MMNSGFWLIQELVKEPAWVYTRWVLLAVVTVAVVRAILHANSVAMRRTKTLKAAARPVFVSGECWDWEKLGCPGCGGTAIYEGPEGGACQNICCANQACQRAFNLGPAGITWDIGNQWFAGLFEPEPEKFGRWRDDEHDSRKAG